LILKNRFIYLLTTSRLFDFNGAEKDIFGAEKDIFGAETNTIGAGKDKFGAETDEFIFLNIYFYIGCRK
jgi:hypothetical protein